MVALVTRGSAGPAYITGTCSPWRSPPAAGRLGGTQAPGCPGALLGLRGGPSFYPLMFFGALLRLCLRAGKLREVRQGAGGRASSPGSRSVPVARDRD